MSDGNVRNLGRQKVSDGLTGVFLRFNRKIAPTDWSAPDSEFQFKTAQSVIRAPFAATLEGSDAQ
jgi:hypothetical protein